MKHSFSPLFIMLYFTACIQNTYQYPDCDDNTSTNSLDDISDIPTPSQNLDDNSDINGDSTATTSDQPSEAKTYYFDDAQSLLYVQVYKDPSAIGSGFAHNHVMRATNWDGSVTFSTANIEACEMSFSLPVLDLAVDEDAMRELVGYGDSISTNDRSQIREHMLASNQLNVAQYDSIWFESTLCKTSELGLAVTGEMFIAGTSSEMIFEMSFTQSADKFYMNGVIDFTHSDFNLVPYEALWGAVRNAEPLKITFDMVGFAG